jgi:molybdenum cofactor cytidylyltransferase
MKRSGSSRLRIVVLAAGFATRLGRSKPLTRIGGISLLRRTLLATAGLGDGQVVVVVPRACTRIRLEARGLNVLLVANHGRAEGLASSVRRGIAKTGAWSGVLLLPVDLAFLRRRELAALVSRWRGSARQVVARRVGGRGGTPLILPRWLKARALSIAGDVGLRELLGTLSTRQRRLVDLPSAAIDVDTRDDLAAARRRRTMIQFTSSSRNRS